MKKVTQIFIIFIFANHKLKNPDLSLMYLEKHESLTDSLSKLEEQVNILSFENQLQTYERKKAIAEDRN